MRRAPTASSASTACICFFALLACAALSLLGTRVLLMERGGSAFVPSLRSWRRQLAAPNASSVVLELSPADVARACAVRPSAFAAADLGLTFSDIAREERSDKVNPSAFKAWQPHDYAGLYERHLGPRRTQVTRLLEIGLGCRMPEGAGRSIPLWRRFLPCASVSILEFEVDCAERFRPQLEGLFVGDQSDAAVLDAARRASAPYDVIVDDGSHNSVHQIKSFTHLFPHMAAGGVYIIEDLHCAYDGSNHYTDKPALLFIMSLLITKAHHDVVKAVPRTADSASILAWTEPYKAAELAALVDYVDCGQGICAIVRGGAQAP